jgi:hypothetical protein
MKQRLPVYQDILNQKLVLPQSLMNMPYGKGIIQESLGFPRR